MMKKLMMMLVVLILCVPALAQEAVGFKNSTHVVQGALVGKTADAVWLETAVGVYRISFVVMAEKDAKRLSQVENFNRGEGNVQTYQGVLNLNKPAREGSDRTYYWVNAGMTRLELIPPGRMQKDEWRSMVGKFVEVKGVWQDGEYQESSGRLIVTPAVFQVESIIRTLTENEKKFKEAAEGN
ncbi:MAG TPA: hypothetical protein VLJ10_04130 [Candidatus Bathyarchaeia archaeon]|nr:hypothetical protein [Candidatus Bathyarchaeia archaeon]